MAIIRYINRMITIKKIKRTIFGSLFIVLTVAFVDMNAYLSCAANIIKKRHAKRECRFLNDMSQPLLVTTIPNSSSDKCNSTVNFFIMFFTYSRIKYTLLVSEFDIYNR